jgi:hypothetical protein
LLLITFASVVGKCQEDCQLLRKKVTDLEDEIRKLSGQQNLQQRIHHHAKIKVASVAPTADVLGTVSPTAISSQILAYWS